MKSDAKVQLNFTFNKPFTKCQCWNCWIDNESSCFVTMKNYLFLILATLLVFVSFYFIISFYFLSKLSSSYDGSAKSHSRNEFDDDGFQFPDELDLSSLPSKYRTRNSKLDLIKSKLVKAFKSCDNSDRKLNYHEVWSEAYSVSWIRWEMTFNDNDDPSHFPVECQQCFRVSTIRLLHLQSNQVTAAFANCEIFEREERYTTETSANTRGQSKCLLQAFVVLKK